MLPHPQRVAAATPPLIPADPDLQEREPLVAEMLEMTLVVRGVPVHAPLVRAELLRQLGEVHPSQAALPLPLPNGPGGLTAESA